MFRALLRQFGRLTTIIALIGAAAGALNMITTAPTFAATCPEGQVQDNAGHCLTPSTPSQQICVGVNGATGKQDCGTTAGGNALPALLRNVINILLFVVGMIAVIMIIVGAIRYVTSNGDQSAITSAKNTIMYAVIGLVIAMLAYAIVNFVVSAF